MMAVKDIISSVVDTLKPDFGASAYRLLTNTVTITVDITDISDTRYVFVGKRMYAVVRYGGVDTTYFGDIASVSLSSVVITLDETPANAGSSTVQSVGAVLSFHHGHILEIVNTFKEAMSNDTYKTSMFPAICLLHDFPEQFDADGQRSVKLTILILTDTKKEYSAANRYTYSFDATLYDLYDEFMAALQESSYIAGGPPFPHTKWDRLSWGKQGVYGNTANIFNEFIDGIEIENLELIITKC